jgi:hypothetical protein
MAVLASADDDPDGAFRLVGAADRVRETIDYLRFPTDRSWLETRFADALAVAGPDQARASLEEGRSWSLEQCVAAAALPETKGAWEKTREVRLPPR